MILSISTSWSYIHETVVCRSQDSIQRGAVIYETRHIRYFIAVAEDLHFRRAAERLHLAQPALSRAIRQLEHAVGTELLHRTNRQVRLTAAGAVFLEGCRQSMQILKQAAERSLLARDGKIGHLSIGYTDTAISGILPKIIERFRREVPSVTLDFVHMFTEQQIDALNSKKIHFGFLTGPISIDGIQHCCVQKDRFVVVLPESHPMASSEKINLKNLIDAPFISGMPQVWQHFFKHLHPLFEKLGYKPRVVQEAFNSEGICGLVAANMGVAILTESSTNSTRTGVTFRSISNRHNPVPTEAAWNNHAITPVMKMFIQTLQSFVIDTPSY